jgi:hypothetical protein
MLESVRWVEIPEIKVHRRDPHDRGAADVSEVRCDERSEVLVSISS